MNGILAILAAFFARSLSLAIILAVGTTALRAETDAQRACRNAHSFMTNLKGELDQVQENVITAASQTANGSGAARVLENDIEHVFLNAHRILERYIRMSERLCDSADRGFTLASNAASNAWKRSNHAIDDWLNGIEGQFDEDRYMRFGEVYRQVYYQMLHFRRGLVNSFERFSRIAQSVGDAGWKEAFEQQNSELFGSGDRYRETHNFITYMAGYDPPDDAYPDITRSQPTDFTMDLARDAPVGVPADRDENLSLRVVVLLGHEADDPDDNEFVPKEKLWFGEPFFVEAEFQIEPAETEFSVTLSTGQTVVVFKTDDPNLYRSELVTLVRKTP